MATAENIEDAALALTPAARARLMHRLVRSLSTLPESELSELLLGEAEQRDSEMESGEVAGIPGNEVFRRLHERYGKK